MSRFVALYAVVGLANFAALATCTAEAPAGVANRLNYLDDFCEPFYPQRELAKLTTPQWIGQSGVEAVVILTIEGSANDAALRAALAPIVDRLKTIDEGVPLTIFTESPPKVRTEWEAWCEAGLTFEPTLLHHDGPLLSEQGIDDARDLYKRCVEKFFQDARHLPTVFRPPGSARFNATSPRLHAECLSRSTARDNFIPISSSVGHLFTPDDSALPAHLVKDERGVARFEKHISPGYVTSIRDYPYPYVVGRLQWELPLMLPRGRCKQALQSSPHQTSQDMKAAIDLTVIKKGVAVLTWRDGQPLDSRQMVDVIDHVVTKYGDKVRFLTFREVLARLQRHLLGGQPLRTVDGHDNGVRLLDINNDGYMDVVVGNERIRQTRVWIPESRKWVVDEFPVPLVRGEPSGLRTNNGVRFGVIQKNGFATMLVRNDEVAGAWHWNGKGWQADDRLLRGLLVDGERVFTQWQGRDRGVRLRDVDSDGQCEIIVGNDSQSAVFAWSSESAIWNPRDFALPSGAVFVDEVGRDAGLRLVDINSDGYQDVVFSNQGRYSLHLYIPAPDLFYEFDEIGWTRPVARGHRGETDEIPMIVRGGDYPNNGVWFSAGHLYVHNEETYDQPYHLLHLSPERLVRGYVPPALSPEASRQAIHVPEEFTVEVVASEPLIVDPIAIEWGADGRLWVVEMRDYPLGLDGKGQAGGVIRVLEDVDRDGKYDKSSVFLDGLNFPSGVMPWRDGALISAAPEIIFAQDVDGDGRADVRKTLYEGFKLGNQQHRVNGFEYGLDNWIYAANGGSGGHIKSVVTGKTFDIAGNDLRLRPDVGGFQAQAGVTEFGRHRDDWGNWFGNTYANWGYHFFMPIHYLERNPHLAVGETDRDIAQYPGARNIYRRSRLLARPHMAQPLDQLTAPCSLTPYRDDLFGDRFANTVFISEVDKNIIRREVLQPDGVTFTSRRAKEDEQKRREFLASTDNWFRPTQSKTGPDGALYVVDMYRLIIEHEGWYPDDLRKIFDFRAGEDRGRIYRIYPKDVQLRKIPRLDQLDTLGLVDALDSPNGWQRDTAQR
ncbi:MAG: PVC-type heme-binding CxxCH protein, partial [Aeoliella sp.]